MLALSASMLVLGGCTSAGSENEVASVSAAADDALLAGFRDPPNEARPRAWWHWMNGNVTQDGIAKDLEWMQWVGLGGIQNFDANLATPQVVDKRLVYMEPDWQEAFLFAGTKAEELGLEMAIAASPGWSETGGPWVPPEDGLKKMVWSETIVEGGAPFTGALPLPPTTTGPFLNIPKQPSLSELMGAGEIFVGEKDDSTPIYYDDARVLAFPAGQTSTLATPQISVSTGLDTDLSPIADADLTTLVTLPQPADGTPLSVRFDFPAEQTVRSLTSFVPGASAMFLGSMFEPYLEASSDGSTWERVIDVALMPTQTTASFSPVTARHFRVVFAPGEFGAAIAANPAPGSAAGGPANLGSQVASAPVNIAEMRLGAEPAIDHFEAKAGFEIERDYYHLELVEDDAPAVDPASVIDLTALMREDGTLDWTPPAGRWKVLRMGWSLLGTTNHPATPEATGLEVDKYDGPAVRRYLEHYLGLYADALDAPIAQQDMLDAILTDSIEVGAANWTPQMVEQFTRLRGYDPVPWLPAMTGVVVGSREQSDRFLYDFRRTLADLLASQHYGVVAEVAHENGLIVYGEALENGRPSLGDDLSMRSFADIPMSAMWTHSREAGPNPAHVYDMRGAASVANLYGRDFVAAESMTSAMTPWDHVPSYLKRIIDLEFVNGITRPVIHTSVHQPEDDVVPGLSLFIFGQYFNRHESWAPLARPWVDYLSRTAYLLQQGRNVADIAYFYGEDAPPAALYQQGPAPDVPTAYAWDFLNSDSLETIVSVEGGDIVTPAGARYQAIYLGGTSQMMTLPVLQKLAQLVREGATVIGMRPKATPSLADNQDDFAALANALWSGDTGAGQVIASDDVEAALAQMGIAPAFRFTGATPSARIPFVEREWEGGRLFFLSNPGADAENINAHFRVTGKRPELWDSVSGETRAVSYRIEDGETIIPMELASDDSIFVLFREDNVAASADVPVANPVLAANVTGEWTVSFQEGRRGPDAMTMPELVRWDESDDLALRYFSGVATYANSFETPRSWRAGEPLWIDLGEVHDLAEIWINGQRAGGLWRAPWRLDVGALAKGGSNTIEVRVANRWVNRLIGDAGLPEAERGTTTSMPTYRADAPLRPSGLVGPVAILTNN